MSTIHIMGLMLPLKTRFLRHLIQFEGKQTGWGKAIVEFGLVGGFCRDKTSFTYFFGECNILRYICHNSHSINQNTMAPPPMNKWRMHNRLAPLKIIHVLIHVSRQMLYSIWRSSKNLHFNFSIFRTLSILQFKLNIKQDYEVLDIAGNFQLFLGA